ncbi:hypothetical protein HK104_002850 [Borealophlyctis nickersoniae]|nr:hypothetical protein HK104_002850 [Borealophlyctis nickersoniae]
MEEFLQIWQVVNIRFADAINKEQFIYFMHILNTRRKGKPLPIGIPLNIKEEFLKETSQAPSRPFTRSTSGNIRDLGASSTKDAKELQLELDQLATDIRTAQKEKELADSHLSELQVTREELGGLADYKRSQLQAVRDEVAALRDALAKLGSGTGATAGRGAAFGGEESVGDLVGKLRAERQMLEARKTETLRAIEAAAAELARERG